MNREEAIKDLDIIRFNPHWDELVNEEYWKELMEMAITALQNQPVWIPVSERLPEPYRESEPHKQTNADRIRSMTDNELAEMLSVVSQHCVVYLSDHIDCRHSRCESSCKSNIKKWLQKESEE